MEITGRVRNGVVVVDPPNSLPEGAAVIVTLRSTPLIRVAKNQKRVEFPLVPSAAPGSLDLTSDRIFQILDDEDVEAVRRSWDVSS